MHRRRDCARFSITRICLCEGAFSLLERTADPVVYHEKILANIHAMIRAGGRFLLTALNGLRLIREHTDADVDTGHFDIMNVSHLEEMPASNGKKVLVVEKGFMPAELKTMLENRASACFPSGAVRREAGTSSP
jgi:hypothetical protein